MSAAAVSSAKVVIVGGGIAGLVAAADLARGGAKVTLLEGAAHLGGRARTQRLGGFSFNQGAHALYVGGAFNATLKRLGVATPGKPPGSGRPDIALYKGELKLLPNSLGSLAKTNLLSVGDKLAFARLQTDLGKGLCPEGAFGAWLDAQQFSPALRATVEAYARLSTYAHAPDEMSAAAVLQQMQMGTQGVIYVDGGWSTLVDGLAGVARTAGAVVRTGASVASVATEGGVHITLSDGEVMNADAVVLALGPHEAHALLPVASLMQAAAEACPARANVLDLGLERLPDGAQVRVQGADRPLYLSLHSEAAKLAPEGGALVHIARYLSPGEAPQADAISELEAFADLAMPGWRPLERQRQRLIGMPVSHGLPRWDVRRPDAELPDAPGVYIAGDWVGDQGLLSDAAAASGAKAAQLILAQLADGRRRAA